MDLSSDWETFEVLAGSSGTDSQVIVHGWGSKDIENQCQLVVIYLSARTGIEDYNLFQERVVFH